MYGQIWIMSTFLFISSPLIEMKTKEREYFTKLFHWFCLILSVQVRILFDVTLREASVDRNFLNVNLSQTMELL